MLSSDRKVIYPAYLFTCARSLHLTPFFYSFSNPPDLSDVATLDAYVVPPSKIQQALFFFFFSFPSYTPNGACLNDPVQVPPLRLFWWISLCSYPPFVGVSPEARSVGHTDVSPPAPATWSPSFYCTSLPSVKPPT